MSSGTDDVRYTRYLRRAFWFIMAVGAATLGAIGASLLTAGEASAQPVTVPGIGVIEVPDGVRIPAVSTDVLRLNPVRPLPYSGAVPRTDIPGAAPAGSLAVESFGPGSPARSAVLPVPASVAPSLESVLPMREAILPARASVAPSIESVLPVRKAILPAAASALPAREPIRSALDSIGSAVAAASALRSPQSSLPLFDARAVAPLAGMLHLPIATPAPAVHTEPHPTPGQLAAAAARSKVGSAYSYGSAGPDAFDCSGLVQWSYKQAGVDLPRTSYEQLRSGTPVSLDQLKEGDMVSFYGGGHSAIYVGDGKVVHAATSGRGVVLSPLSEMPACGARRF